MSARIIIVMGVSGSGKTTIGKAIAERKGIVFIDGDDLHSQENVDKMKNGIPLTDTDRKVWLDQIVNEAHHFSLANESCVFACSALKKKYRTVLRTGIKNILFLYLKGSYNHIYKQMSKRENHYMPLALLKSQFDALEEPQKDEVDVKTIHLSDCLKDNIDAALEELLFL